MSKLIDQLKHIVVDEAPDKTVPAPVVTQPVVAVPVAAAEVTGQPAGLAPDGDVYQKIFAKTDFNQTDVGGAIKKFSAPLETIIPDEALRIRTAVAQAQAQGSVTVDRILNVFDEMKQSLSWVESNFKAKAASFEHDQIAARQTRLAEIQKQLSDLQTEQAQTIKELTDAQTKTAQTRSAFTAALERRGLEIDQQKAHYAALLKG